MKKVNVFKVPEAVPIHVGTLEVNASRTVRFTYCESYLANPCALPLALSIPCTPDVFTEDAIAPYFTGLLPEGEPRERTAAALGIDKNDYVTLLERLGHDCIGDVMFRDVEDSLDDWDVDGYITLGEDAFRATVSNLSTEIASNIESRLSLCGTQGKVGLSLFDGVWHRPISGAASTHILKTSYLRSIPEIEYCCMRAAGALGIDVPESTLIDAARPVISSARYDRMLNEGAHPRVKRLHQADLAQHLGISPQGKYRELDGGTYKALARLLRTVSGNPARDIDQLTRIIVANYLVGNCDNHLKNLSLIEATGTLRLAPAYDVVCTTFFERFSREMGARIGTTRDIDAVSADDFSTLRQELGIAPRALKHICEEAIEIVPEAILSAGDDECALDSTPFIAEDLFEDLQDRLQVLQSYAS